MFTFWYLYFFINKMYTLKDSEILCKLEVLYQRLENSNQCCVSLLKIHLTRTLFNKLKRKMRKRDVTLYDVIRSGCENLDNTIGVYAPDPDSYTVFSALLNKIIEDYHEGFTVTSKHPKQDFGDVEMFMDLNPSKTYILETRIQCSRNLEGYTFVPSLSECHLHDVEEALRNAFSKFPCHLQGKYYSLEALSDCDAEKLREDDAFFTNDDPFLESANVYQSWPLGRGIFQSDSRNLICFVNHEDHLLLISSEEGSNLPACVQRFVEALSTISSEVNFLTDDRMGYLTTSPSNLGTALRAMARIHLPKLNRQEELLERLCQTHCLLMHHQGDGIYDIINKQTLGCNVADTLRHLQDGIMAIIQIEKVACDKS